MSQDPNDPRGPQDADPSGGWAQASPGSPPDPLAPPPGPYGAQPAPPAPGAPSGYPAGYLPPGGKPKRFSGGFVVLGILACWAILVVPVSAATGIVSALGGSSGAAVLAVGVLALLAPLVLGGILVGRGSPQRRGFGLGLFIGWGLAVIIGGGACVAIIVALSRSGA